MLIRPEQPSDVAAIRELTAAAFADVPHSRQTEGSVLDALRAAGALTVSLVAVDEHGRLLGHIAISPVTIDPDLGPGWYGGGPLSVLPSRQRNGIGTALVHAAFDEMRRRGSRGCVVVGDPDYYARFGFTPGAPLVMPGVPPQNVLAIALDGTVPSGTVAFHPAFAAESPRTD